MSDRNSISDNLYVYFVVFSAFFISYIPLVYALDFISIEKTPAFLVFMLLTFIVILFSIHAGSLRVPRESLVIFVLSLFFAAYASISFVLTVNYFNDYQTVFVLSLLSPLYILLATLVVDKQEQILSFIFYISSVYLIFIIVQWLKGDLEPGEDTIFIQVFDVVDAEFYQNINKYLGLISILVLGMFTKRGWVVNSLKLALVTLCVFFMLKIGGRAAIVALAIVLIFWFVMLRIRLESIYFILSLIVMTILGYTLLLSLEKLIVIMQESDITSINRFANLFLGSDSSEREFRFTKAIEQFTDSWQNLFFGGGMNSFSIFTKKYGIDEYPHNIFLELLAEYGITGFILFMLPVFYLFRIRRDRLGSYVGVNHTDRLLFMMFLYFFMFELIIIDGGSSDGTQQILWQLRKKYSFLKILHNPHKTAPHALNIGIKNARGKYIARMDVHAEYPKNYLERLHMAINNTRAANVGCCIQTMAGQDTCKARSIAYALSAPFGVGNSYFRIGIRKAREVDTVPFGFFRRDLFKTIGLFDTEMSRGEDHEFNARVKQAGMKVCLIPGDRVRYYARENFKKLSAMMYQYGFSRPIVNKKIGSPATLRQFVPLALVLSLILSAFLAPFHPLFLASLVMLISVYLTACSVSAFAIVRKKAKKDKFKHWLQIILSFITSHFSYGFGYLGGLINLLRQQTKDSRLVKVTR